MAKFRLSTEERKDIFLYSTEIENLFINEFLPDAPGDYVKVYLFGLMCARYDQSIDSERLAKSLGLSEVDVEEAWIYWESKGLVRRKTERNAEGEEVSSLSFVSQIEALYGKSEEAPEETQAAETETEDEEVPFYISIDSMDFDEIMNDRLTDKKLRELYQKYQMISGRTVSRQETSRIEDAVRVYGITPEIFDFAIDYCADLGKYSVDYIFKVALRWTEEGCRTAEDARKLLEKHSLRNSWYRQVFRALGFNRLPAPADREIMDRWFDDMKFTIDEVLDACSAAAGVRDPNLRYVNKIIENRMLEKGGIKPGAVETAAASGEESRVSRKVLTDYYEYIRTEDEKAREARIGEVLIKAPEMRDLFEAESRVNAKMLSIRPGSANLDERQRLRAERLRIEDNKKQILTANGFPADYLNRKFRCGICKDTGYTDEGMVCSCCRERAAEAYEWHTNKAKA